MDEQFDSAYGATTENGKHLHREYDNVALEASERDPASVGPAAGEDGHGATEHSTGWSRKEDGARATCCRRVRSVPGLVLPARGLRALLGLDGPLLVLFFLGPVARGGSCAGVIGGPPPCPRCASLARAAGWGFPLSLPPPRWPLELGACERSEETLVSVSPPSGSCALSARWDPPSGLWSLLHGGVPCCCVRGSSPVPSLRALGVR